MLKDQKARRAQVQDIELRCCSSTSPIFLLPSKGIIHGLFFLRFISLSCRVQWADYFDKNGIQYAFYSAATINALQEARREAEERAAKEEGEDSDSEDDEDDAEEEEDDEETQSPPKDTPSVEGDSGDESENEVDYFSADEEEDEEAQHERDPRAKILSVDELENLFIKFSPDLSSTFRGLERP